MLKKVITSRVTKNPLTGYKNGHPENIYVANKVVAINQEMERTAKYFIGKKKDLLYRINSGEYVSLSDFSYLNKLLVDREMFKSFDYEEYCLFLKTYGVSTKLNDFSNVSNEHDSIGVVNLETLNDYDLGTKKRDLDDYIRFINSINRVNERYVRRNFKDPTINPETIKSDFVIANAYNFLDYVDRCQTDTVTNTPLSKIYSHKLFK